MESKNEDIFRILTPSLSLHFLFRCFCLDTLAPHATWVEGVLAPPASHILASVQDVRSVAENP